MKRAGKAIVLLSGGMDSATVLAIASRKYRIIALHFNYHQRTEKKELWSFNKLCRHFRVDKKVVIDMDFIREIGGSTLIKGAGRIPEPRFEKGVVPSTYVPFRNGIMLSVAAATADRFDARAIYIGAVEVDSSGYPDCREIFISHFEKAVRAGTRKGDLKVIAPLIRHSKADIVRLGIRLGVPFQYTWSCYKSENLPCLKCESCILRMRAFESAGVSDPILLT